MKTFARLLKQKRCSTGIPHAKARLLRQRFERLSAQTTSLQVSTKVRQLQWSVLSMKLGENFVI